jgi:hypothetical protein
MRKINKLARMPPPLTDQERPLGISVDAVQLGEELAVVPIVSVAVPGVVPVMLTGLVALKLTVGIATAPLGLVVITAVRATLPVKPLTPVTVMVLVPPAPCATVILPGEDDMLKLGGATVMATTVSATETEAVWLPKEAVRMTVAGPAVAVLPAFNCNTLDEVTGLVLNVAVTPLGRPEADNVALPLNPVTLTVSVVPAPSVTERLVEETEMAG